MATTLTDRAPRALARGLSAAAALMLSASLATAQRTAVLAANPFALFSREFVSAEAAALG
jgi:hypothetical protein